MIKMTSLTDEENKSLLERLAENGITIVEGAKSVAIVDDGLVPIINVADFSLCFGDNQDIVSYFVGISQEVRAHMKLATLNSLKKLLQTDYEDNTYETVRKLIDTYERDFDSSQRPIWIDDAERAKNPEYLREIVLKVENAYRGKKVAQLEQKYKFKLRPVVSIERIEASDLKGIFKEFFKEGDLQIRLTYELEK